MASLKNTKIYRGGVTAPYITFETSSCTFHANTKEGGLDFRFNLASKGGGTTSVLLRVGTADLPEILNAVATNMPENVGVLSDCAAIANKKNLRLLNEARLLKDDERARANSLIDKLEEVSGFVNEKYLAAPAGEDEKEAQVNELVTEIINSLREMS